MVLQLLSDFFKILAIITRLPYKSKVNFGAVFSFQILQTSKIYHFNLSVVKKTKRYAILLFDKLFMQVPNYFSLPLRSTTPLDPHVKNFPPNMQDTIFGTPFSLQGQLGLICLFHEALQHHQVKTLYESGECSRVFICLFITWANVWFAHYSKYN